MDDRPKRKMVLRKISTNPPPPVAQAVHRDPVTGAVLKPAPLPPLARLARPPMPSRPAETDDDNELAPLPPRSMKPPVPLRTRTVPPPPPLDRGLLEATPIPLTRLQPSRGRFQSAIDPEGSDPGAVLDEALLHDSASITLPPMVASLAPPLPAAAYTRRSSARSRRGRMIAMGGVATVLAAFAVLGGVALGQRVARSNDGSGTVVATAATAGQVAVRGAASVTAGAPKAPAEAPANAALTEAVVTAPAAAAPAVDAPAVPAAVASPEL
ncbi:MAG: hypothetical protein ACRENE_05820, partial [Polyangiaceae bacterium]